MAVLHGRARRNEGDAGEKRTKDNGRGRHRRHIPRGWFLALSTQGNHHTSSSWDATIGSETSWMVSAFLCRSSLFAVVVGCIHYFFFSSPLSVTQHIPTFSGWRFMHADGWVGMVCGMGMVGGCLLLGLGVRWIFCQASFQMGRSSEGRESPLSVVVQIQA
jgi:hypothetical protein